MYQAAKDFIRNQFNKPDAIAMEWHKQCALTPDIWKLEQSMYQLIFIPDDMMRGKHNNKLIADAGRDGEVPVHPACFTLERFTFWKKDLGVESFGIPLPKEFEPTGYLRVRPTPAKIKGQLYAILSPRIIKLDIHRQNGLQFVRSRQDISLPYRDVTFNSEHPIPKISEYRLRTESAWMYVGIPEYWDGLISDMFQVRECNKFELNQPKFWVDEYYKWE